MVKERMGHEFGKLVYELEIYIIQIRKQRQMKSDPFISNVESSFIVSETQQKKIGFLERELQHAEKYGAQLQKTIQINNETIEKLIQNRSNHEILTKYYENIYKLQKCLKLTKEELKLCNGRMLIEMQLRIQERSSYYEKLNQLENLMRQMKKQMEDKEQGFTVVVNRLRKYENIREVILENKLMKDIGKQSQIKVEDKDDIIKRLSLECDKYRVYCEKFKPDVDKKLEILKYALNSRISFEQLKKSYFQKLEVMKSKTVEQNDKNMLTASYSGKKYSSIDKTHKELVKQLKKELLSNKLMEEALNEAIEKNEELIVENEGLRNSNSLLEKRVGILNRKIQQFEKEEFHNSKDRLNMIKKLKEEEDLFLMKPPNIDKELEKKKDRQKYYNKIKSKNYQVNIKEIQDDVEKIGQFMVLYVAERPQKVIRSYSCFDNSEERGNVFNLQDSLMDDLQIQEI